jgi:hypothetical protein
MKKCTVPACFNIVENKIDHQLKLQKREDIIPKINSIVTKFPPRPKIDEDGMATVEYSLPTVEKEQKDVIVMKRQ